MKKFKITDGFLRKLEKRLSKIVKADGLYVSIDEIDINTWDDNDFSLEFKVRWGKMADGKCVFQNEASIWTTADGNLDFIAGQFYEKMLAADGNE